MSRRDRDVVFVERDSSSPLWWLVVGGALGAGLALLFAPEQGSKTRRILARRLARLRSTAEDVIGEFREAASEDPEEDEEAAVDEEHIDEEDDAEEEEEEEEEEEVGALSARQELERRLAAARARRQHEPADEDEEPVA